MKHPLIYLFLFISISACNYSAKPDKTQVTNTHSPIDTSALVDSRNLNRQEQGTDKTNSKIENTTTKKIFIHIIPSSDWIDSLQKLNGEDGWNTIVNDNEYYIDLAKSYLKTEGYSEKEEPTDKIWKLEGENGVIKEINSDTLKDNWGLIIFDGIDNPYFYKGTEPEKDLK